MNTYVAALVLASVVLLPQGVRADSTDPVPPSVPEAIQVPEGYVPFLAAHAVGTQGYVCVAVGTVLSWMPFGPQATLYDVDNQQILTHFLNPTPFSLLLNPTWQHSRDSSLVWGQVISTGLGAQMAAPCGRPLDGCS